MKYDIFFSYSRKDSIQVDILIGRLRREIPSLKIWYDLDGINSVTDFQSKILKAIDESNTVLFICSENSLSREYCRKEIMYAKSKGKTIIAYVLNGIGLEGRVIYEYGNIRFVHCQKEDEVRRLISDIKNNIVAGTHGSVNNPQTTESDKIEVVLVFNELTGEFEERTKTSGNARANFGSCYINGHEYVDLGLPSGIKWATRNIGAPKPEDYGFYFAWGELARKSNYSEENSLTENKDRNWLIRMGYIGMNNNLLSSHDVAHVKWGASWRMPTQEDTKELWQNVYWEWTTLKGVKGCLLTSKINGKTLFFPAAGYHWGTKSGGNGVKCYYWLATANFEKYKRKGAYCIYSESENVYTTVIDERLFGFPIRPVSN